VVLLLVRICKSLIETLLIAELGAPALRDEQDGDGLELEGDSIAPLPEGEAIALLKRS
jgi:hypothetical protein